MSNHNDDEFILPEDKAEQQTQNELENELKSAQEQAQDYKEQLIRSRAEIENQRKRMEREIDNAKKFALQSFITQLLPAKDSMEKGLDVSYMEGGVDGETLFEGMTSTLKICEDVFKTAGVEEIDPLRQEFNPELHEAMAIKKVDDEEPNIVLCVYQKGYLLNGRLIRPARVEVSATNE